VESYTPETAEFTLGTPTKDGYDFAGWIGSNGTNPELTVTIMPGTTGDLSYTATWSVHEYSIYLDLNGGTGTEVVKYTIETDDWEKVALPSSLSSTNYDGVWRSASNYNVNNSFATLWI
jgi:uncharacterized repeat protein (TIGR02543 family)